MIVSLREDFEMISASFRWVFFIPSQRDTLIVNYQCAYRLKSAKRQIGIWRFLGSPSGGAVTALAVTERALSAPYGGTSPRGRGKCGSLTNSNLGYRLRKTHKHNYQFSIVNETTIPLRSGITAAGMPPAPQTQPPAESLPPGSPCPIPD